MKNIILVLVFLSLVKCTEKKGKYDIVDKENPKIAILANREIDKILDKIFIKSLSYSDQDNYRNGFLTLNKGTWELTRTTKKNPTNPYVQKQLDDFNKNFEKNFEKNSPKIYIRDAAKNTDNFLKTIKQVESYASYGTESNDKFNLIEHRITFKNGNVVNELYTGNRVLQAYGMGNQFLTKWIFEDGRVIKSYSNGVELTLGPDGIKNDILKIVENITRFDWQENKIKYFFADKTQIDIDSEWKKIKK